VSLRNAVLFNPEGKQTNILRAQWTQRGALQPIMAGALLLERDRSPTRYFREVWAKAFPTRRPLPFEPIAEEDGRGTTRFWDLLQ
jgi:hypothetical protein